LPKVIRLGKRWAGIDVGAERHVRCHLRRLRPQTGSFGDRSAVVDQMTGTSSSSSIALRVQSEEQETLTDENSDIAEA
jgi:hypothetical protein